MRHLLWPRAAPPAAAHGDSARDLAPGAGLCRRAAVRPRRCPRRTSFAREERLGKGCAAGARRKKEVRVVWSFFIALRRFFIFLIAVQLTELKVGVNRGFIFKKEG